jgi:hypothetical protein
VRIDVLKVGQFLSPEPVVSACSVTAEGDRKALLDTLATSLGERFGVALSPANEGELTGETRRALYRETFRIHATSSGAKATANVHVAREPAGWLGLAVLFIAAPAASFGAFALCFLFHVTPLLASLAFVLGALVPIVVWKKWTDSAAKTWQAASAAHLSAIESALPSRLATAEA